MMSDKKSKGYLARQMLLRKLDAEKLQYTLDEDRPVVRLTYSGECFCDVCFALMFDDDGLSVGLRVFSVAQFKRSELMDAYELCNRLNREYRWMRFFIDEDRELTLSTDAILVSGSVGAVCHELLTRAVDIVDAVCKELK